MSITAAQPPKYEYHRIGVSRLHVDAGWYSAAELADLLSAALKFERSVNKALSQSLVHLPDLSV